MAAKKANRETKKAKKSPSKSSAKPAKKGTKKNAAKKPAKATPTAKKLAKKPAAKKTAPKKPAAKKAAPSKPAAKKPAKKTPAKAEPKNSGAVVRRDRAGHLDPAYKRDLLAKSGGNDRVERTTGFLGGRRRTKDALAERLAEEFVETVTSGEDEGEEVFNEEVPEDRGGPFVVTTLGTEVADDVDLSNPRGATREPFPRT